jgi:DNA polymerase
MRSAAFLDEMGVGPLWIRRSATAAPVLPMESLAEPPEAAVAAGQAVPSPRPELESDSEAASLSGAPQPQAPSNSEIAGMDWARLEQAVAGCVRCGLCQTRTRTVFGVGDRKANWLFVGEGPGRNEDLQGEPFVGPAGKLLDNMLLALDLRRGENAFIANVVKCRPTGADGRDRPPAPEEVAACLPYLERQIALLKPSVIVALGKTAATALLGLPQEAALASLRGKVHSHAGLPLVVTYHPAYLLRKPADKSKSWSDLCLAMQAYGAAP